MTSNGEQRTQSNNATVLFGYDSYMSAIAEGLTAALRRLESGMRALGASTPDPLPPGRSADELADLFGSVGLTVPDEALAFAPGMTVSLGPA